MASFLKREQQTTGASKDPSYCVCEQKCYMLGLSRSIGTAAASQPDQIIKRDWQSRLMIMEFHKKKCPNLVW